MKSKSYCPTQGWIEWMLEEIKCKAREDVFAARSWILTAKHILPSSFTLLYEAFKVELNDNNIEQCGQLLSEMFQQYPSEPLIWNEFKSSLISGNEQEGVLLKIFECVPQEVQLTMLKFFADQQTDIFVRCELTLLLMRKNSDSISQLGIPLTEKLVETEKELGLGNPLNGYRKLLVCNVLPVICEKVTGISHKHFYKWLQKAIEFYVTYLCAAPQTITELFGNSNLSWDDLHTLLQHISVQCEWAQLTGPKSSIQERMNHISDLHRRSKTDLTGNISKKQIFYSSILLLMEGAINYAKLLDPHFYQVENPAGEDSHLVTCDWGLGLIKALESSSKHTVESDLENFFFIAKNSWLILLSNETFRKDINHLYKRWKMEKWTWFQFFLVNNFVSERNYESAIAKLLDIIKCSGSQRSIVHRCICQLGPLYLITNQPYLACQYAMKFSSNIGGNSSKRRESSKCHSMTPFGTDQIMFSVTSDNLLQLQVDIVSKSLNNVEDAYADDRICGHLIVLCQHEWPHRRNLCLKVLEAISKKSNFTYSTFFDYVIVGDILEEVALLKNIAKCELILFPSSTSGVQRVTRGTGKTASEEFKMALKRQIREGEIHCNDILLKFFVEQQDSILNCLQLQSQPNSSESMMVDC